MKNAIAYYYNLYSYDIHQINDKYKFVVNNITYVLTPCNREEINYIYTIYETLIKYGVPLHHIVININNNIYTTINNTDYILLQIYNEYDKKVELMDIINFTFLVSNISFENNKVIDWALFWENKIDYFEYQVNQFGKKYPKIRESFGYYSGITETGIELYRMINNNQNNKTIISHKRINYNSTLYDLYNPLNLIVDYKVRDPAEYFKSLFLVKENIFEDIIYYFNQNYLTGYECLMFFNRMLYPSFYFDIFENIIEYGKETEKLDIVISKNKDYEDLIIKIYNYLSHNINIPDIEWLKKT